MRRRVVLCLLGALACSLWQISAVLLSLTDARGLPQSSGPGLSWRELWVWLAWSSVASLGPRRLVLLLQLALPQYSETVFFYSAAAHPGVAGLVALTIDDAVCRQNASQSMLTEVLDLLRSESAHATFFVSSRFLHPGDLRRLRRNGHELGNHMPEDREYADLSGPGFKAEFLRADAALAPHLQPGERRWFRAPQGRLTRAMASVLKELNVTHALGDSYADDWAIRDPVWAASLYLRQAVSGSVVIVHMPERGFREHTLENLRLVLRALAARGLRAVTLGDLAAAAAAAPSALARGHGRLRRPGGPRSAP